MSAGNYAAAWALFRGLERYQEPEDDEVLIAIVDEFGEDAILRGLALVGSLSGEMQSIPRGKAPQ